MRHVTKAPTQSSLSAWAELHKKLVRLRPHQFFKISNVTVRRLQFSQAMYCVNILKASPEFKSYLLPMSLCIGVALIVSWFAWPPSFFYESLDIFSEY